jgi:hypothetical protein
MTYYPDQHYPDGHPLDPPYKYIHIFCQTYPHSLSQTPSSFYSCKQKIHYEMGQGDHYNKALQLICKAQLKSMRAQAQTC